MQDFLNWLTTVSEFFGQIVPIVLAIFLVALVFLIIHLIKLTKRANETLSAVNKTIINVDQSINKLQSPLDTAAKIAGTLDLAHTTSLNLIDKGIKLVSDNYSQIKEFISSWFKTDKATTPIKTAEAKEELTDEN